MVLKLRYSLGVIVRTLKPDQEITLLALAPKCNFRETNTHPLTQNVLFWTLGQNCQVWVSRCTKNKCGTKNHLPFERFSASTPNNLLPSLLCQNAHCSCIRCTLNSVYEIMSLDRSLSPVCRMWKHDNFRKTLWFDLKVVAFENF